MHCNIQASYGPGGIVGVILIASSAMAGLFLLLAGCATTPQQQVVSGIRTGEPVKIPVLIPCLYIDEVPKVPGTWMSESQPKEKRRLAILADLKELEEYLTTADSLLRGCAKPRTEVTK